MHVRENYSTRARPANHHPPPQPTLLQPSEPIRGPRFMQRGHASTRNRCPTVSRRLRSSFRVKELVADELRTAPPQTNPRDAKHQRSQPGYRHPVKDRMCPARREGQVLPHPQRQQRRNDDALKADHQKKLTATAPLVQQFNLVGGKVPFLKGEQCISHCVLSSPAVCARGAAIYFWIRSRSQSRTTATTPLNHRNQRTHTAAGKPLRLRGESITE